MRIAILGLGRMGAPMARNLIELHHEVALFDPEPARAQALAGTGAQVAGTLAEAAGNAQVALTMVNDDAAEEALTFGPDGLLEHLAPGAIHLCMSSIGVAASRRLAEAHQDAGQGYVAAPVLGSPSAAASRHLWILAAGPEVQVNRCLVVLEGLGRGLTRVGTRAELAHALKLGANALKVAMAEGLAEVLAFGEKSGFAPSDYLRVLNLGLFKSPLVDALGGMIVRRDHEPFDQTLDQAAKDMERLLEASEELGSPVPLAQALLEQLREAEAAGKGGLDLTALALVRREQGGLAAPSRNPRRKSERRKDPAQETPRAPEPEPPPVMDVVWDPAPDEEPAAAPSGEGTYAVMGTDGIKKLDVARTTHFEQEGEIHWAWAEGARYQTFWHSFSEVEEALGQVPFVKATPRILLNPQLVQKIQPLFAGRAKVIMTGDLEFLVGRDAAKRLELLIGL